jgi:hypothetical protein
MKRSVVIIAVIIVVVAVAGAVVLFSKQGSAPLQIPENQPAGGGGGAISYGSVPSGDEIDIQTSQGAVRVNNFYKNLSGVDSGTSAVVLREGPGYVLWYYRAYSSFEVALSQGAGPSDEKTAVDNLLKILGVDSSSLCKLKVSVTIPYDRGEERASRPLSFCPKSIQ